MSSRLQCAFIADGGEADCETKLDSFLSTRSLLTLRAPLRLGARSSLALIGVLMCAGVYVGTDSTLGAEGMAGWYWLGTW